MPERKNTCIAIFDLLKVSEDILRWEQNDWSLFDGTGSKTRTTSEKKSSSVVKIEQDNVGLLLFWWMKGVLQNTEARWKEDLSVIFGP